MAASLEGGSEFSPGALESPGADECSLVSCVSLDGSVPLGAGSAAVGADVLGVGVLGAAVVGAGGWFDAVLVAEGVVGGGFTEPAGVEGSVLAEVDGVTGGSSGLFDVSGVG